MAGAKVDIAKAAVLRAWRKAEHTEVWLQFEQRGGSEAILRVADAVDAANAEFEDADQATGDFVFAEGPWPSPMGSLGYIVFLSRTGYEEGVLRWLETFAARLEAAGLAGRITATPNRDHPSWSVVAEMPLPQLVTFLAYGIVDRAPPRQIPYRWNVTDDTTARIAANVEHAAFPDAETYFRGPTMIRTGPAAAAAALRRTLPRDCIVGVTHLRVDPPRVISTSFDVNGMAARSLYDPAEAWHDRLQQGVEFMVAFPEATDQAFVQYSRGITGGWGGLNVGTPALPPKRESQFRYNPHLLAEFVPDARGALVVTDAHLDRAHDLSDWSVEALGHGRHLVQARDLSAWYAQPEPHPDVLAQARADFGDMILTLDAIAANPPPAPSTGDQDPPA